MAWLNSIFGGGSAGLTLVLIVLGLAVALVILFWVFRKIAGDNALKPGRNRQPRLSVTDAAIVDDKRRLVLVRRDNVEHLVMIGGPTDIVVEQNIVRAQPVATPAPQQRQAETPESEPAPPRLAPAAEIREFPRPADVGARDEHHGAPGGEPQPTLAAAHSVDLPEAAPRPQPAPATEAASRFARLRGEAAALVGRRKTAAVSKSPAEAAPEESRAEPPAPALDENGFGRELEQSLHAGEHEAAEPAPPFAAPQTASMMPERIAPTRDEAPQPFVEPEAAGQEEAPMVVAEAAPAIETEAAPVEVEERERKPAKPDSMEEEMQRLLDELAGPKHG